MRSFRAWLFRLSGLLRIISGGGTKLDRDIADEMESHLQLHIEDNIRAGLDPDSARREALMKFGGVESARESYRDQRSLPVFETLARDFRYAARTLWKSPGFTLAAVSTLALGIGANTAIFSIINGVLLKPLGFKDQDRLVRIWEKGNGMDHLAAAYPNFKDWKAQNKSFEEMAAFRDTAFSMSGIDNPERISARQVTSNFLSTLGVAPALGRDFSSEDDKPGANLVAVISDGLWTRRFGRQPSAIGGTIRLNDDRYTVIGVLPVDFHFYSDVDVLTALNAKKDPYLETRAIHPGIQSVARLKPGVSVAQASADLAAIAQRLGEEYPDTNKDHSTSITPLFDDIVGNSKRTLFTLLAAVACVLLIACANVASLMLARAAARQKEIAIRAALGAGRLRIVRMLLAESISLSLLGGALGLLVAYWGTGLAIKFLPSILPRTGEIGIDARVLLFAVGASLLTGIIFGLAPSLQSTRSDLNDTLKEGGRGDSAAKPWIRNSLVVAEVALAVVLLAGSGLLIRSIAKLHNVNPGFDPRNVLSFRVSLSPGQYPDAARIREFYREFLDRTSKIPGVEATAATSVAPMNNFGFGFPFFVTGRPAPASGDLPVAMSYLTSSNYLKTMRIPLLRGRFFDDRDTPSGPNIAVIDDNLAREYFPDEDPIGKGLTIQAGKGYSFDVRIIGVVGHVKQDNLDTPTGSAYETQIYTSYNTLSDNLVPIAARDVNYVIRTGSDSASYLSAIRSVLNEIAPGQVMYGTNWMEDLISNSMSDRRFMLIILGVFSILSLVLASVGIYGVVSYSVTQRKHEIGVRVALGAARGQVLGMVLGHGAKLMLSGVGIGMIGAVVLTRFITSYLFGVSPTDPLTLIGISFILIVVAMLASLLPARKAMAVDPISALRCE